MKRKKFLEIMSLDRTNHYFVRKYKVILSNQDMSNLQTREGLIKKIFRQKEQKTEKNMNLKQKECDHKHFVQKHKNK